MGAAGLLVPVNSSPAAACAPAAVRGAGGACLGRVPPRTHRRRGPPLRLMQVEEAYGNAKGLLGGAKVKNVKTGGRFGGLCFCWFLRRVFPVLVLLFRMVGSWCTIAGALAAAARAGHPPRPLAPDTQLARCPLSFLPPRLPTCLPAGEVTDLPLAGLFFAIGHEPATAFLGGQVGARLASAAGRRPAAAQSSIPTSPSGWPGWLVDLHLNFFAAAGAG